MIKITELMPPAQFTKLYFALQRIIFKKVGSLLIRGAKRHEASLSLLQKQRSMCVCVCGASSCALGPFRRVSYLARINEQGVGAIQRLPH